MMTKAIAKEVGQYGITCNCVLPSGIPTNINKRQFDDPVMREQFRSGSVLNELGDSSYVAQAIEYFVSADAKWTTGALLNVDGGYSL